MTAWHFFSILVGLFILLQSVLNKQFSAVYGLSFAVFVNALVFAVLSFLVFILAQKNPLSFPEFLPPRLSHFEFKMWHLIPGICGFGIVLLTPWSIQHLGAAPVFILIISSQLILGSLWDYFVNNVYLSPIKLLGLLFVMIGSYLFHGSQ